MNNDFNTAMNNGVDMVNMSLGNNVVRNSFPCGQLADYTNTAILLDNIVRGSINNQNLIFFKSAGNERQGGAPCGQFETISSPATAKNPIVVGGTNSNDNSIFRSGNFGPTDDGRLKPDIVAPACQTNGDDGITSTVFTDTDRDGTLDPGEAQDSYESRYGTSMATPVATGTGALLLQQWRSTRGAAARPEPHIMKAILIHTATDLGNAGPDYQFGWGSLDTEAAVDLLIAADTAPIIHVEQVVANETDSYVFSSDGATEPRVTLVWDDPAGTRLAATALVNDLDVRLVDPNGNEYQPWVLDQTNPNNAATRGNDAISKHPPAEPEAFWYEPLKAAGKAGVQ